MNTLQIGVVTWRDNNGNMIPTKLEHMHVLVTRFALT